MPISETNVEIYHRSEFLKGTPDEAELEAGLLEFLHPDATWVVAREHPQSRTLTGHRAIIDYLREWQEMLPGVHFEEERVLGAGEKVLAIGAAQGAGAGSGAAVRVPIGFVITYRAGLVTRVEEYLDPGEALRVAGVSD